MIGDKSLRGTVPVRLGVVTAGELVGSVVRLMDEPKQRYGGLMQRVSDIYTGLNSLIEASMVLLISPEAVLWADKVRPGCQLLVSPKLAELSDYPAEMRALAGQYVSVSCVFDGAVTLAGDFSGNAWPLHLFVLLADSTAVNPKKSPYHPGEMVLGFDDVSHVVRGVKLLDTGWEYLMADGATLRFDEIKQGKGYAGPEHGLVEGCVAYLELVNDSGKNLRTGVLATPGGRLVKVEGFLLDNPGKAIIKEMGDGVNLRSVVSVEYLHAVEWPDAALCWVDWARMMQPMRISWRGMAVKAYAYDSDGKLAGKGVARCHASEPEKFNLNVGVNLAMPRALENAVLRGIK